MYHTPLSLEPVDRRGGQVVDARRSDHPVRGAGRSKSGQCTLPAGLFGARGVLVCFGRRDECADGRGGASVGVERLFDGKSSALRGKVKNHLDRSNFWEGRNNPALAFGRRAAAASAALGVGVMPGKAGEKVEGRRMSFFGIFDLPFGLTRKMAPSSVCCRRVSNAFGVRSLRHCT